MPMLTYYVYYTIFFQDQAEYNAAVAASQGTGFGHCPFTAASTFAIPWPLPSGDLALIPKGIYSTTPYGIPPVPGPGVEIDFPGPSGVFLKSDVDSVVVPGQAGVPPAIWPATNSCNFVWWGQLIWQPAQVAGAAPTVSIPQRRFIGGFEHVGNVEVEGADTAFFAIGRCASRVTGGQGLRIRGNSGTTFNQTKTISDWRPAYQPKTSWERLYIRVNQLGTNELIFWHLKGFNPANEGCTVRLSTAGVLLLYNATGATTGSLEATSPTTLTLGKWYLLDILLKWPTLAGESGEVRLYLNHVLNCQFTINTGVGMDRITYHVGSAVGQFSTREADWEYDLDDWINADVPNVAGVETLLSLDWQVGSHVKTVNIVSGDTGDFTQGDYNTLNQYYNPSLQDQSQLQSSTALEQMTNLVTDLSDIPEFMGGLIGSVAMCVEINVWNQIAENCRFGYSIAGAPYVIQTSSIDAAHLWKFQPYLPVLGTLPVSMVPLVLFFERPNSANLTLVNAFSAIIEQIGVWGDEDAAGSDPYSANIYGHNCRYPNTPYSLFPFAGPIATEVYAVGGTYAGNGTATVIDLPDAVHFVYIRRTDVTAVPMIWTAACEGGHDGGDFDTPNNYVSRVWYDSTGFHFVVTGDSTINNLAGATYQYIAFCDPGMRFNYCDSYDYAETHITAVKALFDPTWQAEAGFVQPELLQSAGGIPLLAYKGPGHAGTTGVLVSGDDIADLGSFPIGQFDVGADSLNDDRTSQFNFSLWRTTDNCGAVMLQIHSYIGDGNAFRTINLPLTTGRYPLWVMVVPNSAVNGFFRDPSAPGNDSHDMVTGAKRTDCIVGAGIDSIDVGISLNANLKVYEVFVIMGDSAGWNNGTFYPFYCQATGDWELPDYVPTDLPIITGDGGMNFNGDSPLLAIKNMSGIYTLVNGKTDDTIYTGFGAATVDVKKPDPTFKTGYIGG